MINETEKRNSIIKFVEKLANRYKDYEYILEFLDNDNLISFDQLPCLAVLFGELSKMQPELNWDKVSLKYLSEINDELENKKLNASTFYGLSGIGYAVLSNYNNNTRYIKFLNSINSLITRIVDKAIEEETFFMENMECINGLSGIGRYLIYFKDNKDILRVIENILKVIIKGLKESNVNDISLPGWFVSKERIGPHILNNVPNGMFIFGVAHGVAGILSFLSISLINGIEVENQKETINSILEFITQFEFKDNGKTLFPAFLSVEEYLAGEVTAGKKKLSWDYASWCYGNSGYSRAFYLAGKALNNQGYIEYAKSLILETTDFVREDIEKLGFIEPTFCHGYAGYMHTLNLFYKDTKIEKFRETAELVKNKILQMYNKDNFFGFESYRTIDLEVQRSIGLTISVLLPLIDFYKEKSSEWSSMYLLN